MLTIFLHSPNPPTTLEYHRLSVAKRNKPVYACLQCYCVSVLDLHPFSFFDSPLSRKYCLFFLRCRFSKVSRDASLNVELSKMCVLHFSSFNLSLFFFILLIWAVFYHPRSLLHDGTLLLGLLGLLVSPPDQTDGLPEIRIVKIL